ncbi:MAG: helix-turn-helix domain-containing protein [Gammaproteobacteria bacterium]
MTGGKCGVAERHRWVASLRLGGVEKAILRVLADYAHCDTLTCWPSIETIVRESGFSERPVQRAITRLGSAKIVGLIPSKGRKANRYVLRIANPVRDAGLNAVAETGLKDPNPVAETPLPRRRDTRTGKGTGKGTGKYLLTWR